MAPTPKSQDRKRKVADDSTDTPVKRRATAKVKTDQDSTAIIDAEDPFSFESKEDSHPEPLKNISIERTAFGGVKFSRSPPNASQRYASVEKIAERRGNVSGTLTSPILTPRPGSSNLKLQNSDSSSFSESVKSASKSKKATPRRTAAMKNDANELEKKELSATPISSAKKKLLTVDFEKSATPKEKKMTIEDYCVVPEVNANQQLAIDHIIQHEEHKLLDAGARVYALWNREYYAAIVCDRDGHSRYYVHYVEDNLNRLLPPNGVIPLSILQNGMEVSVIIADEDGQDTGKKGNVLEVPSNKNADEWFYGNFKVSIHDEEGIVDVKWDKIYLTKDQHKVICASDKNTTVFVEEENIITESRSSRRSRAARFSLDNSANRITTPQSVNRSRASRAVKTPKTAINEEEVSDVTEKDESEKEKEASAETPEVESRLTRSSKRTPAKTLAKTTPATKTPRGRKTPARNAKETETIQNKEELEEKSVDQIDKGNMKEKEELDEVDTIGKKDDQTEVQKEKETKEPNPENAEKTVENVSPSVEQNDMTSDGDKIAQKDENESKANETLEKMDVDEPTGNNVESVVINDSVKALPILNNSTTASEQLKTPLKSVGETTSTPSPQKQVTSLSTPSSETGRINGNSAVKEQKLPTSQESSNSAKADVSTSAGTLNGTTKLPVEQKSETLNIAEAGDTKASQLAQENIVANEKAQTLASQMAVPISTISPPANEQEASIFKNMKFVLTSATRLKKNTDFNKRDYRTKIEERGGGIIDDFSSLKEGDKAFLIADTYYRTHKYLSALSLSIPCVKHDWIYACVVEKKLVDHVSFMLPAGESSLVEGNICQWRPLKHTLLSGKRVWVYSNVVLKPDERAISFVDIWSSIIKNLGAQLVQENFSTLNEKLELCSKNPVDVLLTDSSCEKQLAEKVCNTSGIAVSSEWVIQAIVTGELPDVNSSERFRFDTSA